MKQFVLDKLPENTENISVIIKNNGEEIPEPDPEPEHIHHMQKIERVVPTCCKEGNIEYYQCTECKKYFVDKEGSTEIEDLTDTIIVIDEFAHNWGEWKVTKKATEEAEGEETRICANDNTHIQKREIPKLNHVHQLSKVERKEATCDEAGNIEFYICTGCGRYFSDANGKTEISEESTIISKLPYQILEGENQEYKPEENKKLVVRANGSVENFVELRVDANYIVKSGSTVIELSPEFVKTLSSGKHQMTFVYKNGETSTDFTVATTAEPSNTPATNNSNNNNSNNNSGNSSSNSNNNSGNNNNRSESVSSSDNQKTNKSNTTKNKIDNTEIANNQNTNTNTTNTVASINTNTNTNTNTSTNTNKNTSNTNTEVMSQPKELPAAGISLLKKVLILLFLVVLMIRIVKVYQKNKE